MWMSGAAGRFNVAATLRIRRPCCCAPVTGLTTGNQPTCSQIPFTPAGHFAILRLPHQTGSDSMVDMAMISGAMSALRAAGDLTKLIIASHDANVMREKAVELQTQILTAQQNALTAQSDQFMLLERVRQLEKQIADLEAWDTEKQRYKLEIVARGATVYALKEKDGGPEPPHWICSTCYQNNKKSVLQAGPPGKPGADFRMTIWKCNPCGTEIRVPMFTSPTRPSHESEM
jgi:hypothetical protein